MGLDDKRFKGDVDDDFRCPICRDIVEDPIASQCEHIFCKICITQWLERETSCPVDRKSLNISQLCDPSRYFRNFYSKLVIKCAFESNGCKESCKIEVLNSHQNKCKFNPIVKSNCKKGCEALLTGNELISHNCVEYLKSIILGYEQDLVQINKREERHKHLIALLEEDLSLKCTEINVLRDTIECQSKEVEKGKIRELEQHEFIECIESTLSLQSKAIHDFREKLERLTSISTSRCTTINNDDGDGLNPQIITEKMPETCKQQ